MNTPLRSSAPTPFGTSIHGTQPSVPNPARNSISPRPTAFRSGEPVQPWLSREQRLQLIYQVRPRVARIGAGEIRGKMQNPQVRSAPPQLFNRRLGAR
jgi:hypothetical protein